MSSWCRKCGRPVRWCDTISGQRLPLDPDPVPDGAIMMLANGRIRVLPVEERAACPAPLFVSHLATCPVGNPQRRPS